MIYLNRIRWANRNDMPEILAIEQSSHRHPRSENDIIKLLRGNCICLVADRDNQVVGFIICQLYNRKYVVLDLAVSSQFRRQGVGNRLINHMRSKLAFNGRRTIEVSVPDDNLAAQLFFRTMAFRATSIVYNDRLDCDMYIFEIGMLMPVDITHAGL